MFSWSLPSLHKMHLMLFRKVTFIIIIIFFLYAQMHPSYVQSHDKIQWLHIRYQTVKMLTHDRITIKIYLLCGLCRSHSVCQIHLISPQMCHTVTFVLSPLQTINGGFGSPSGDSDHHQQKVTERSHLGFVGCLLRSPEHGPPCPQGTCSGRSGNPDAIYGGKETQPCIYLPCKLLVDF